MKLTQLRSWTTEMVSPVSRAPRPFEPAAQCRTAAPSKWPTDSCQGDPGYGLDLVVEQFDARRGTLNPLLIGARDEDLGVEGVGEVDVGGVEVRVRQADRVNPAEVRDVLLGGVVE